MDSYYFSRSTLAFYPEDLMPLYEAAGTLPDDIVAVSADVFDIYSGISPQGKMRGATEDGQPTWVDLPPLSHEQEVDLANAEKQSRIEQANDHMNSKQWPGKAAMGRLKDSEKAEYTAWLDYLDALEAVEASSAPDIHWPIPPAQ
ncbi:tail fiber assembly protein [Enterobacter hormaechei]|uniref:tail fiber assembly protein n=1 Tax=Enterobacter hormaechei TaxID=158836 RepID=UPI00115EFB31|nr:tail fiber assembly protein [Enterobacter hormaechei]DAU76385.1 MAG TPA: tail fiber assembly protein [Caudoviricetes sp.]